MSLDPCAVLPASSCIGFISVVGFLASSWKAEAALIAAIGFVCVLGLAARAEEARKKARWKARIEAWRPSGRRRIDRYADDRGRRDRVAPEAGRCRGES